MRKKKTKESLKSGMGKKPRPDVNRMWEIGKDEEAKKKSTEEEMRFVFGGA